jgi:hypothetical protein
VRFCHAEAIGEWAIQRTHFQAIHLQKTRPVARDELWDRLVALDQAGQSRNQDSCTDRDAYEPYFPPASEGGPDGTEHATTHIIAQSASLSSAEDPG